MRILFGVRNLHSGSQRISLNNCLRTISIKLNQVHEGLEMKTSRNRPTVSSDNLFHATGYLTVKL